MENKLSTLRKMLQIQGRDGTWNYNPYMFGMYNGMEFCLSILEDREPNYRDAPDLWLEKENN